MRGAAAAVATVAGWLLKASGDVTGNPELPQRRGLKYAAHILRVYESVTAMGSTNVAVARIWLPSNLHFNEWEALTESSAETLMVDYLT